MIRTTSSFTWMRTFFPASITISFIWFSCSRICGLSFSMAALTSSRTAPANFPAAVLTLAHKSRNPYCTISEESSSELEMNSPTMTSTTSSLMVTRICLPVLIRVSLSFLRSSKICGLFSFRILMMSPRILESSFLAADFTFSHKSENP